MDPADELSAVAHRLGLTLSQQANALVATRHGWSVELTAPELVESDAGRERRAAASWMLFGVRLGLDKRAEPAEKTSSTPMRFRRTPLRRYHEAPSVHGDRLPILVPRITHKIFEAIAGEPAFRKTWQIPDLELLIVEETGTRIDVLTAQEQHDSEPGDEQRWEKVRSALFYQSYKLRPRQTVEVSGGVLRIFETTEGFGASRALLLPEYDYDAAREYGFLAVPTRDQVVIARPHDSEQATAMLPELRDHIESAIDASPFGLTDAVFQLDPDDVELLDEPAFVVSSSSSPGDDLIGDINRP